MKLIEALPIISKNESIFVDLKIAGSGSLDKRIESLSKKIDNLFFLGRVDRKEVINYIDNASLCIVPFENSIGNATSSPLKVMEYLSRDKLILASKLPNFLNDFENYSGLFFMDNNNPKTIAKSVSNCIKNYENFIPKENEGKELIRDNFTWKIQANKINLFLNKH